MNFFITFKNFLKVKDLRRRFLIILLLLALYRFFSTIPLPDVDLERFRSLFKTNQFFGLLNIFSGGALSNLSIALLGVGPYITASIILQLLTLISPKLKNLYYEEGEMGRMKINQYARLITVPISFIQAIGFLNFLNYQNLIILSSIFDLVRNAFLVTVGSMIVMWLGEIITEQKLGNGISLIVFSGIVANLPVNILNAYLTFTFDKFFSYLLFILLAFLIIGGIVFINESERRIPLVFSKRIRGNRLYGGQTTYLPVKLTQAGVIPIIFALAVLVFPQSLLQFLGILKIPFFDMILSEINTILNNNFIFASLYFILVFAFTYLYTSITFNAEEISKNFQKTGAFIPGIRPGVETQKFLNKTLQRINLFGGLFLGLIAILPYIFQIFSPTQFLIIGGTSILILVSVAIETVKQIEAEMSLRKYEI